MTRDAHTAAARAAWPELAWSDDDYARWLDANASAEQLAAYDPREVVLCWAAGRGDPAAHALFEQHFMREVAENAASLPRSYENHNCAKPATFPAMTPEAKAAIRLTQYARGGG